MIALGRRAAARHGGYGRVSDPIKSFSRFGDQVLAEIDDGRFATNKRGNGGVEGGTGRR